MPRVADVADCVPHRALHTLCLIRLLVNTGLRHWIPALGRRLLPRYVRGLRLLRTRDGVRPLHRSMRGKRRRWRQRRRCDGHCHTWNTRGLTCTVSGCARLQLSVPTCEDLTVRVNFLSAAILIFFYVMWKERQMKSFNDDF